MKEQKKLLRKQIREKRALLSGSTLKEWSSAILSKLETHPLFIGAKTVLLYYSMDDEVDTHAFVEKWAAHKRILLPVVRGDVLELRVFSGVGNMATGAFGIKEPGGAAYTDYPSIDLAIIPGVAFDSSGNRLGRGKGYYDKLLPQLHSYTIGLCFPYQLVKKRIPAEFFDIPVREVMSIPAI